METLQQFEPHDELPVVHLSHANENELGDNECKPVYCDDLQTANVTITKKHRTTKRKYFMNGLRSNIRKESDYRISNESDCAVQEIDLNETRANALNDDIAMSNKKRKSYKSIFRFPKRTFASSNGQGGSLLVANDGNIMRRPKSDGALDRGPKSSIFSRLKKSIKRTKTSNCDISRSAMVTISLDRVIEKDMEKDDKASEKMSRKHSKSVGSDDDQKIPRNEKLITKGKDVNTQLAKNDMNNLTTDVTRLNNKLAYDKISVRPKRRPARNARGAQQSHIVRVVESPPAVNGLTEDDVTITNEKASEHGRDGLRSPLTSAKPTLPGLQISPTVEVTEKNGADEADPPKRTLRKSPIGAVPTGFVPSLQDVQAFRNRSKRSEEPTVSVKQTTAKNVADSTDSKTDMLEKPKKSPKTGKKSPKKSGDSSSSMFSWKSKSKSPLSPRKAKTDTAKDGDKHKSIFSGLKSKKNADKDAKSPSSTTSKFSSTGDKKEHQEPKTKHTENKSQEDKKIKKDDVTPEITQKPVSPLSENLRMQWPPSTSDNPHIPAEKGLLDKINSEMAKKMKSTSFNHENKTKNTDKETKSAPSKSHSLGDKKEREQPKKKNIEKENQDKKESEVKVTPEITEKIASPVSEHAPVQLSPSTLSKVDIPEEKGLLDQINSEMAKKVSKSAGNAKSKNTVHLLETEPPVPSEVETIGKQTSPVIDPHSKVEQFATATAVSNDKPSLPAENKVSKSPLSSVPLPVSPKEKNMVESSNDIASYKHSPPTIQRVSGKRTAVDTDTDTAVDSQSHNHTEISPKVSATLETISPSEKKPKEQVSVSSISPDILKAKSEEDSDTVSEVISTNAVSRTKISTKRVKAKSESSAEQSVSNDNRFVEDPAAKAGTVADVESVKTVEANPDRTKTVGETSSKIHFDVTQKEDSHGVMKPVKAHVQFRDETSSKVILLSKRISSESLAPVKDPANTKVDSHAGDVATRETRVTKTPAVRATKTAKTPSSKAEDTGDGSVKSKMEGPFAESAANELHSAKTSKHHSKVPDKPSVDKQTVPKVARITDVDTTNSDISLKEGEGMKKSTPDTKPASSEKSLKRESQNQKRRKGETTNDSKLTSEAEVESTTTDSSNKKSENLRKPDKEPTSSEPNSEQPTSAKSTIGNSTSVERQPQSTNANTDIQPAAGLFSKTKLRPVSRDLSNRKRASVRISPGDPAPKPLRPHSWNTKDVGVYSKVTDESKTTHENQKPRSATQPSPTKEKPIVAQKPKSPVKTPKESPLKSTSQISANRNDIISAMDDNEAFTLPEPKPVSRRMNEKQKKDEAGNVEKSEPSWVRIARRHSKHWEDEAFRPRSSSKSSSNEPRPSSDRPAALSVVPKKRAASTPKPDVISPKGSPVSPSWNVQSTRTSSFPPISPSPTAKTPSSATPSSDNGKPSWLAIAMKKQKNWGSKEEMV